MTQKSILLVDDSKSARYALRLLLQKQGFQVDMADSAEVALEMLKAKKPDAIFMDHMMPGMDGFEATELIKTNPATTHIPVVMCTSNDQDEYVRQAKSMGSLGILPKPATSAKLVEMLGRVQQEIEAVQSRKKKAAARAAAGGAGAAVGGSSAEALQGLIIKTTRAIIKESVEPLIEKKVLALSNTNSATGDDVLKAEMLEAVKEQTRAMVMDASRQVATEVFESRIDTHMDQVRQELMEQILDVMRATVTQDPEIVQGVRTVVLEAAVNEAQEAAVETATSSARTVAETIVDEKTAALTQTLNALSKKINLAAFLAAAVGLAAAAVVYFLGG